MADWARMVAEGVPFETVHRRKDGSEFPVEVNARRLMLDGRPHYLTVVRDRSEELAAISRFEQAVQTMINRPQETWALFVKGERKNLDDELNRRAWMDTLPRFAHSPAALDRLFAPDHSSVTLQLLEQAALALGRRLKVELA